MKGDKNPLNIFRVIKYKKQNKQEDIYPYNRSRSIHGGARKGENYIGG